MQTGKKIFALLAGIFLIVSGAYWLIYDIIQAFSPYADIFYLILNIQINLLFCLAGLFLLLKKPLISAIMMSVAALFFVVMCARAFIYYVSIGHFPGIVMLIANILAIALFAAGLYGKRLYALIMCLAAACLQAILLISDLVNMGGSNVHAVFVTLADLLLMAAMVLAGFYLLGFRRSEEAL